MSLVRRWATGWLRQLSYFLNRWYNWLPLQLRRSAAYLMTNERLARARSINGGGYRPFFKRGTCSSTFGLAGASSARPPHPFIKFPADIDADHWFR
jgi:hypothetical protein